MLIDSPFMASMLVATIALAVFVGVNRLSDHLKLTAEVKRKIVHISLGLSAVSFPWLFADCWPVVMIALLSVAVMIATRTLPVLKNRIGGTIHDVERKSLGEIYFPLAIALLFILADGDPVLYVVPLLVLSLADAVAALIGVRFGTLRYSTSEGSKSVEGSISFFIVAFFSAAVPLFLLTEDTIVTIVLVSLVIGLLVMLFEAISVGGFDNLFIPIGCYGLLQEYQMMGNGMLFFRLIAILLLICIGVYYKKNTTLKGSGQLAAILVAYMNLMVGGWQWLIASLILYLNYIRLWPGSSENQHAIHTVRSVAAVAVPGMIWLTLSKMWQSPFPYFAFVYSYGVHLTIIGMLQIEYARPSTPLVKRALTATVKSWVVFLPAFFLHLISTSVTLDNFIDTSVVPALLAAPLFGLASLFYIFTSGLFRQDPQGRGRWLIYASNAFLVSTIGLLALL